MPENYLPWARKYRPNKLSDLVGQPVIVRTLTNSFKRGTLHTSYLFIGQFGSGKTSCARIVAAMENCERTPGVEPCGQCDICRAVFAGRHEDIREIDAASEAGKVEQIRLLKDDMLYSPIAGAQTRYYIIDESHRMTPSANDALLKTIEEPEAKVRFILCTTDPQKMAPTVGSRCQRYEFRKIMWPDMAERLAVIAEKEGIRAERPALNLCAKMAEGSLRNAIQNFEKLVNFSGTDSVLLSDAEKMFGTPGEMAFYALFDCAMNADNNSPDATSGFRLIDEMLREGASFETIYQGLAAHLDRLMVGLTSSSAYEFVSVSEDSKEALKSQLRRLDRRVSSVLSSLEKLSEVRQWVNANMPDHVPLRAWYLSTLASMRRRNEEATTS